MNFGFKKVVSVLVSILALFIICHFRTVPVSQFWKGFRILYVYTEDLSEFDILTILEKHGCSSVISKGVQRLPVVSPVAPVQAQGADSYLYKRNGFFTDKNNRALVFYVPDSQTDELEKAIRELSAFKGSSAGTDGKSSFPWIAPIVCCFLFAVLFFFSKNRILYTAGSFFFILLAFCRPLFTVGAAVSLFLFAFFIFHRIWGRGDFLRTALNSHYVLLFALSPLLVLLISSPVNALFYLLALAGTVSVLAFYYFIQTERESLYSFKPVFIRSARMIPIIGHLGIRLLGALLVFLCVILVALKFSGNVSEFSSSQAMPSLPSPVSHSDSQLPQLKDLLDWSWNSVTFPYRKIGENAKSSPNEGDVVSITDYQNVDGKLVPVSVPAFVFNSDFRDSVLKTVDKLDYPAVEKMLIHQGKNVSFGYAKSSSSSSSEKFATLLILIFITITAALGINYIIGRKRYGLSV
ncbi:hypothetical protein [uncultured Treponema sp.]|uniref:hypothetical protein n=1 Tax=uncultured Treponema sp. TaxID=162155 RepID=UPI0025DC671F|nr:hypothetical protein [uncultured Treponema sp.]